MYTWLSQNHKWLEIGLLLLLAASFLGPWTYEADGVPPPAYCDPPHVLLTPQRCVDLVSGAEMIGFLVINFPQMLLGLLNGAYAGASALREIAFVFILLLPALPVLVLAWRVLAGIQPVAPVVEPVEQTRPVGRIVLYVALTLGWLAALGMYLLHWPPQPWLFWGLWLYLIVNDAILMLNVLLHSGRQAQNVAYG